MKKYVIGVDFGTDSVRALIVDASTGTEQASAAVHYPRWAKGMYCDPAANRYRQHPADYIETVVLVIRKALSRVPVEVVRGVAGIGFDTTGSTPTLVDRNGTPLAMLAEFADDPDAMFVLWKDHTAIAEAEEINHLAHNWETDYTKYSGGIYSSEWAWSKALHTLRANPKVRAAAYAWVEHCDWMAALLTGNTAPETMFRSRCAAGHKAMWHADWGGLPSDAFLTALDPVLSGWRGRFSENTHTSQINAGTLTEAWAARLGLSTDVVVSVGILDAHAGAVGAGIKPHTLVRAIGTSTCDILIAEPSGVVVPGICGQVDGSVVPGFEGFEAGQSAFGDIFAWFRDLVSWGGGNPDDQLARLTEEAQKIEIGSTSVVATDWLNGRRSPDADPHAKGTIAGLTLGTTAPAIFRGVVEATAYGSRAISDRFRAHGIQIDEVIGLGGIARKSDFVMQTMADVMGMPIRVAATDQTCAFGSAMLASVAAGIHRDVPAAQKSMDQGHDKHFTPIPQNVEKYQSLYNQYLELGRKQT